MAYQVSFPRLMRVGAGALADLSDIVDSCGISRPLIVTDPYLESSGVAQTIFEHMSAAGLKVAVFAGTVPDPTTDSLLPAMAALTRHEADGIVALGGGSPIDTAKAMAVLANYPGTMPELKSPASYNGSALPIVAIPTTAGTGSEATRFTVIGDSATGEKMLCIGDSYMPSATIVDFELTLSMPARLTADTGIDALTHAVEAYVSRQANPFSDALALAAMSIIGRFLRRAYADGNDRDAREQMMAAATLAGMAFSNSSVALVHGMSRPLGAHFHLAHGLANAMLFAEVTAFSIDDAPNRYATCSRQLGLSTAEVSDGEAAATLVGGLRALARDLQVPTPAALGVARVEWHRLIPMMADQAIASGSPANNPRVPNHQEIESIYAAVYG